MEITEKQFKELNDKLDRLVTAVCGDEYDVTKPGLIREVARIDVEIYGQDGKGGMKEAMDNYRANQNKIMGAALVLGFIGTIAGLGAAVFEAVAEWVRR